MSQAKIAATTNLPAAHAVSSRRSLFGGAAAVVLGTGITAGVAASAADLLPGDSADAVLMALCSHAQAADDRSVAVLNAIDPDIPGSDPRWSAAYDESGRMFNECREGMSAASEISFQTAEGLRAKASLALREMDSSDVEQLPLIFSVLSQLAGKV